MCPDHARALAMAYELRRLLGEIKDLPENGAGSAVEDAWNRMEDIIGLLEPPRDDGGEEEDAQNPLRLPISRSTRVRR
jgi:hypothetical protein